MRQALKSLGTLSTLVAAAMVAVLTLAAGSTAYAQAPDVIKQIKLTEPQVKGFIAAQGILIGGVVGVGREPARAIQTALIGTVAIRMFVAVLPSVE